MSAWLQKQRKSDLVAIADDVGLKDYGGMLKDELCATLDKHLRDNANSLSNKSSVHEFYERGGSPVKKERGATAAAASDAEGKAVVRRRRTTKVKEEPDSPSDSMPEKSLAMRTPKAVQRVAERMPLPPSPAVVADAIDRQTAIVKTHVDNLWQKSGVNDMAESLRDMLSSVVGIEAAVIMIEAWGLQRETLPWRYAFEIPAIGILGSSSQPVFLPDLFLLLTSFFWSATTLWASTSLLLPLVFGYFFNLTLKRKTTHGMVVSRPTHPIDPLTFNAMKGLITWLVYSQGIRLGGLFGDETVQRVDSALPGGYVGVMIGAGLGALASVYDAVLKK